MAGLRWTAWGLLGALVLWPYVPAWPIELELMLAQPLTRLGLLGLLVLIGLRLGTRRQWRGLALSSLGAALLLAEALSHLGFGPPANPVEADLHVYSQNLGMAPPAELSSWLQQQAVDLVLCQEVYSVHLPAWERLAQELDYHMAYQLLREDAGMGGLVLSRRPLTVLAPLQASSMGERPRSFLRALIEIGQTQVEVYAVHLESLPIVDGERRLFGSSRYRLRQSELLFNQIARSPHPVLLAGDLNAAPLYPSIQPLRRILEDVWEDAGWGPGFTYPAGMPLVRIDAVLHRGLVPRYAEVVRLTDSDHRGLRTGFSVPGSTPSRGRR